MKGQHLLRLSLTFAMVGSGGAVALLLAVLLKAAADEKLGAYPAQLVLLCLFLAAFAGFGIVVAIIYRRLARGPRLRGGRQGN